MMKVCLLSLVCVPDLQDAVIDFLLAQEDVQVFNSSEVHAYAAKHASMSLLEQVSGRQKKLEFEIQLQEDAVQRLLALLKTQFADSNMHYRLRALLEVGEL